jgi:hypothetical protein
MIDIVHESLGINPSMVVVLSKRLDHARAKHPEGADIDALIDECIEVEFEESQRGSLDFSHENYVYELYDVIAVAWRLIEQAKKGLG